MLSERTTKLTLMALVALALLAMVAIQIRYLMRWGGWAQCVAFGSLSGTFVGLIALAAAYSIIGRGSLRSRLALSVLLCVAAVGAVPVHFLIGEVFVIPYRRVDTSKLVSTAGLFSLFGIGQWLLVGGLLWIVIRMRSLRLSHVSEIPPDTGASDQQFGVRDVLLLTAVIGALLAAIRWLPVAKTALGEGALGGGFAYFAYLALCNVFILLPLLVAPLLRRYALVATLVALVFVAVVTIGQNSALEWIAKVPSSMQLLIWHRIAWATNYVQALWVLLALGIVRAGGYRLAAAPVQHGRQGEASAEAAR